MTRRVIFAALSMMAMFAAGVSLAWSETCYSGPLFMYLCWHSPWRIALGVLLAVASIIGLFRFLIRERHSGGVRNNP
jgi:hypothetical protein